MGRRSNQFKSLVYTKLHWLTELYGWAKESRTEEVALPPLARLAVPLRQARIALVTSAGVHLGSQTPFDMENPDGDASFRVIPGDVDAGMLTVTHDYYDHAAADRDINCVFPIERLRELVATRDVAGSAPRHVGFMGHILGEQWHRLVTDTAHQMADIFRDDRVDAVVASPG